METMDGLTPKEHIESIFNDFVNSGKIVKKFANLLKETVIKSLSGDSFINELLQNADDASVKIEEIESDAFASFVLTENYLIFSHKGKHFTREDVEAIADAANPDREKINELNQTGHKGIGFKSVFYISEYVYICSDQYTFRFDKNHKIWEKKSHEYPWQVIPVWTEAEEVPEEIRSYVDNKKVNFVLKFKDNEQRNEISQSLSDYCSNPKNVLFLRKISCINFQDISKNISQSLSKKEQKKTDLVTLNNVNITKNNHTKTEDWYIYTKKFSLPEKLLDTVKKSDIFPNKYKKNIEIPISIAVQVNNGELQKSENNNLYCTFETKIPFPFVVNTEFLLDVARKYWHSHVDVRQWNLFLLKLAFVAQIELLNYFAINTNLWSSVLKVLVSPDDVNLGLFENDKKEISAAFKNSLEEKPIITNYPNESVLLVKNSNIDTYGFIDQFGDENLQSKCAHPHFHNFNNRLKKLGAPEVSIKKIIELLKNKEFLTTIKTSEKNIKFITYLGDLMKKISEADKSHLLTGLSNTAFILDSNNELRKPENIYLQLQQVKLSFRNTKSINVLHSDLNKDNVISVLKSFKVEELSLKTIIKEINKNEQELVTFFEDIVAEWDKLTDEEKIAVKYLKIKSCHDLAMEASEIYLTKNYGPVLELEKYVDSYGSFISSEYKDDNKTKKILLEMGVQVNLDGNNQEKIIKNISCEIKKIIGFTQFVFNEFYNTEDKIKKSIFNNGILNSFKNKDFDFTIVNTKGKLCPIENCYLDDIYEPELPLKPYINDLNFVSGDYIDCKENSSLWRKFFNLIGVESKISIQMIQKKDRPICYQNKLSGRVEQDYFAKIDIVNNQPNSKESIYFFNQEKWWTNHTVDAYFHIKFIDSIIKTPYFWGIIQNGWTIFSGVESYYNSYSKRSRVFSSIQYYVEAACQLKHKKSPNELYSPDVSRKLGNLVSDLDVLTEECEFSDDRLNYFGFKTKLSIDDCVNILEKMSKKVEQIDFEKIVYVYQHLLKHELADYANPNKSLELLSQTEKFINSDELYYLNSNELTNIKPNNLLLMKPRKINDSDFLKIINFFGVRTIENKDLQIETENKIKNVEIIDSFKQKIVYIALLEASKNNIDSNSLVEFLNKFMSVFLRKIKNIEFFSSEKIILKYKDCLTETVSMWIVDNKVYLAKNLSGPKVISIYKYFQNCLSLSVDATDLWEIVTTSEDVVLHSYPVITEGNKKIAEQCLMQVISQPNLEPDETIESRKHVEKRKRDNSPEKKMENFCEVGKVDEVENPEKKKKPDEISGGFNFFGGGYGFSNGSYSYSYQPQNNSMSKLTEEENKIIGKNGEQYAYNALKEKYKTKKSTAELTETKNGFFFKNLHKNIKKEVIWHNKNAESYDNHDIKIVNYDETGIVIKEKYIEVKSTKSNEDYMQFRLPKNEYNLMQNIEKNIEKPTKRYQLFCVKNVEETGNERYKIVKSDKFKTEVELLELKLKIDFKNH